MSRSRRQDDAGRTEQEEKMAVEGIGRSNIVPIETLRRRHAAKEYNGAAPPEASSVPSGNESNPVADEVAEAHRAAEARPHSAEERAKLVDRFKSETADLPDVRRDKVIEAKLRISTGYYNRDEIRREVLRSVLANLLPPPPASSAAETTPAAPAGPAAPQPDLSTDD